MDILEDREGRLTIREVSSPELKEVFRPDSRAVPNFGMTSNVYWVRFTIEKKPEAGKLWLLELDFPLMDYVDLYIPRGLGGFDRVPAGEMRPMSVRELPHGNPVFPIVIDGPGKTFYLRADGRGLTIFPLTAWSPHAFRSMDHRRDLLTGCYFGAMIVMFVYNFCLFLSLHDRSYFFYILHIFCYSMLVFVNEGFVQELFDETPWLNHYSVVVVGVSAIVASLLFTRSFLATDRNAPSIDRFLKTFMLSVVLLTPAVFVISQVGCRSVLALAGFFTPVISMGAGLVCLRKGYRPARYFVLSRFFLNIGTIFFVLDISNILPHHFLTYSGMQLGSAIDAVLLSFALADRIRMMQREKEAAEAVQIRTSHLAAIGELAACMAHEINTPVNTIINSADLLLESEDRKAMERDVEVVKKEGRRIATIVKSLLFFSRRGEDEKVPFPLSDLVRGTLDLIEARLRKENIGLTVRIPPDLRDVVVHPQQIEQVFLNIVTNAMHALEDKQGLSPIGKSLEIGACEISVDDRPFVRVTFLDNGIGIPEHLLDTVKDPFVTTKKTGTGLGLSISRQIIDEHCGAVDIETREGEYTKVIIDLPAVTGTW